MKSRQIYKKSLIIAVTVIFSLVNLSIVSTAMCTMKDKSSCCCKQKSETKSCCAKKNAVKYVQHCVCEIKEAKTDPAELLQGLNLNQSVKNIKVISPAENSISVKEIFKEYSNSTYISFQSPPSEDINTLKCVLRI
jgi:hypothetical protein